MAPPTGSSKCAHRIERPELRGVCFITFIRRSYRFRGKHEKLISCRWRHLPEVENVLIGQSAPTYGGGLFYNFYLQVLPFSLKTRKTHFRQVATPTGSSVFVRVQRMGLKRMLPNQFYEMNGLLGLRSYPLQCRISCTCSIIFTRIRKTYTSLKFLRQDDGCWLSSAIRYLIDLELC